MDKAYWDKFYAEKGMDAPIISPSTFAVFCQQKLFNNKKLKIIELGCGNGRDAIYFAHNNHHIIAIDQSTVGIDIECSRINASINENITAIADDFVSINYSNYHKVDAFYSRFTLHAITKDDEIKLLSSVYSALQNGGLLAIEVRTIKDPLYGEGTSVGNNAFVTDHYRRFIDTNIFLKQVLDLGFKLIYFTEENNLSIYKEDNPVLMRIILEK